MLVLDRKVDQVLKLQIPAGYTGGEILIMLVQVNKKRTGHAKFGIEAPPEVLISRGELPPRVLKIGDAVKS